MKSTRDRILQMLLVNPNSTISDLAEAVDINNISVRHHLTYLQAEGFVQAQEIRHGVGRPRLTYSLTDQGAELFPMRYLRLINLMFGQLKSHLSKKEIDELLVQIANEISGDQAKRIRDLPFEEKLDAVRDFLAKEGFVIEWNRQGSDYLINEVSCPFYHITQNHPEVCTIDQVLFSTLLSTPVEKVKCILSGGNLCSYLIQPDAITETK